MVEVMKVALMPDHIHLLLNVRWKLPEGKHLGNVVRGFKTGCTRAWWQLQDEQAQKPSEETGRPSGKALGTSREAGKTSGETGRTSGKALGTGSGTVPEVSPSGGGNDPSGGGNGPLGSNGPSGNGNDWRPVLFEAGYHDRIIIRDGMLENICRYMDENPFRARLREERPFLMQRRLHLWIHDREYAAFGNLFLLNCAAGKLLILAPWQMEGDSDYARFHSLNDLARDICTATDTRLLSR